MIDIMFQKGSDKTLVRINNKTLKFAKVQGSYLLFSDIEGIKFSIAGILKEFPDLEGKGNEEILKVGKQRFMSHIESMNSEEEVKKYIIGDLRKHGFLPLYTQRKGQRIQRWQP